MVKATAGRPKLVKRGVNPSHVPGSLGRVRPETAPGVNDLKPSSASETADPLASLFHSLDTDGNGSIRKCQILEPLLAAGIQKDDPRIEDLIGALEKLGDSDPIILESFRSVVMPCGTLVEQALRGNLAIPDFAKFTEEIAKIFYSVKEIQGGEVATYIPQLARVDPDKFGVSVCTIDGQRQAWGNSDEYFCMQSSCKPILYCMALDEHGTETVHRHVGREPSGVSFNELTLNARGLPHNPMINAGAIMSCALLRKADDVADRFDHVMKTIQRLTGGRRPGFNNSVYLSEKGTADRNFALGHFMKEKRAFPEGTNLHEVLDFYFQCCSIEVTTRMAAQIAATLANAGVCPITGERVFNARTVKCALSLMSSCGMYDFSGEFAFSVGLPAKSGVSGILIVVVPNVGGFASWSPPLDQCGNSVKGLEFCRRLVTRFNFHAFDSLVRSDDKLDPRKTEIAAKGSKVLDLIWAASIGDLHQIRRLVASGVDLGAADYDGRTPLHLAASEGHTTVIEFILAKGVTADPVDRWGNTPLQDALREGHDEVAAVLRSAKDRPVSSVGKPIH